MTKAGQQILIAQLEDTTGTIDVVVFAKLYPQVSNLFEQDKILIVKGRLRMRERPALRQAQDDKSGGEETPIELSVSANEVVPFERPAYTAAPAGWHVVVSTREQVDYLAAVLDEWPGTVPVMARIGSRIQRLSRGIAADARVRAELARIFGAENVFEGLPE